MDPTCPVCDGEGEVLGQLGNLIHYRCRACGMDFSTDADPREAERAKRGWERARKQASRNARRAKREASKLHRFERSCQ